MRKFSIVPVLVAALFAAPALAEVEQQSDAGFVLKGTAEVAKPPLEAWALLVAPAKWWNGAHSWSKDAANLYIDPQASGCFCELLPLPKDVPEGTRRGSVEHMHVLFANPGKILRLSGALGPLQGEALNGTLTVELTATGGGSRLKWEYVVGGYMRFPAEQIVPAVDGVLTEQFARFAAAAGPVEAVEAKP